MVGRIGSSYSNYYSYQRAISQIRLGQAISKNPQYQNYQKQVEQARTRMLNDTYGDIYKTQTRASSMDFLKDYTSTMGDVMQSANTLRDSNSAGVMNTLNPVSSDTGVADVTARYNLRQGRDLTLDVTQIAASQQNRSDAVKSIEAAAEDMAFSISGPNGRYDFNISAAKDNGAAKNNAEMLREAAAVINKSSAGVMASVEQKDGNSVLTLQSRETGTDAAFEVTGQLGAAQGLQNVAAEAANAQYSVKTGGITRDYTSQSNSVQLDAGRLQADLKAVGSTNISAQPDADKIADSVSKMLDSYNKAVDFLGNNSNHGRGAIVQMRNFERSLTSEEAMKRLGISENKEGQLVLDKAKLTESLKNEPTLTKQLLSGPNGLAQTVYNRGVNAMNTNSASLISNDLDAMNENNYSFMNPIQQTSVYSRNGAYAMNNYAALGMMMNYLV